ncbi:hypothetical protein C0Q70_15605 [Pomacea canaliculata]|uniref:Uncharacterized protein n=1 Tax=Pomacea canaliculata TaxID=400727 RepID=A0A2T7NVA9_POMCA|nr:hypothetical protein C0Q70_15605 [Pomacea canaliculata]
MAVAERRLGHRGADKAKKPECKDTSQGNHTLVCSFITFEEGHPRGAPWRGFHPQTGLNAVYALSHASDTKALSEKWRPATGKAKEIATARTEPQTPDFLKIVTKPEAGVSVCKENIEWIYKSYRREDGGKCSARMTQRL